MKENKSIRILIGGSPCTHWSIAQNKNREILPSGEGWELFKNYLIAKEKFQPDYFLYENNKSASQAIKNQISFELGVELQYINSALVSAQNRQRFYAHNIPNVEEPKDRNIFLKDIIEDKNSYIVNPTVNGKSQCIRATCYKDGMKNLIGNVTDKRTCIAKCVASRGRYNENGKTFQKLELRGDKTNTITTVQKDNLIIESSEENIEVDNKTILQVINGNIQYKENIFPINLPNGIYKIRKLTPLECERLQTLPDNYTEGVSNTQRYKCIGNGWTAEVIIHILSYLNIPKDFPIEVLSMYDGIATGMYCLDKLGYTNITYKAYEIDKYAIQIAKKNYPNIIECGDAFQVRNEDWRY